MKLYGNSQKEAERLMNTVRIFSKLIAMESGISTCAHVTMNAEKPVSVGGMELFPAEVIPELESDSWSRILLKRETADIIEIE